MDLSNRVAVVTGGGSGIGMAVASAMGTRGAAAVALVDMSEGVVEVAEALNARAGRTYAVPFKGNVTDEKFRASVYDAISSQYGPVSLCVPAAGITRDELAVRVDKITGKARIYSQDLFKLVVDVNLIAPVYWALEMIGRIAEDRAAKGLKRWTPGEHVQGSVVFIGSISSQGNRGPDLLRQHQGRPGRRSRHDHARGHVPRRALWRDPPRLHRHADGARHGHGLRGQEHPALHAAGPADPV
jgi:3-oxoacyl-[acyl-carrier protein] reductase